MSWWGLQTPWSAHVMAAGDLCVGRSMKKQSGKGPELAQAGLKLSL